MAQSVNGVVSSERGVIINFWFILRRYSESDVSSFRLTITDVSSPGSRDIWMAVFHRLWYTTLNKVTNTVRLSKRRKVTSEQSIFWTKLNFGEHIFETCMFGTKIELDQKFNIGKLCSKVLSVTGTRDRD